MKNKLAKGLALTIMLSGFAVPTTVSATAPEVTIQEAKKAALFQVMLDQNTNPDSPWYNKSVKVEAPVPVFDATETQTSYLINLTVDGTPAGFVEVSDDKDVYPILTFSNSESRMNNNQIIELKKKQKTKDKKQLAEKIVVLGPANFGLKEEFEDGSAEIITPSFNLTLSIDENKAKEKQEREYDKETRKFWKKIDDIVSGATDFTGNSNDGVTADLSWETGSHNSYSRAYAVPNYDQTTSTLWQGPSGCAPTSAANALFYWSSNGYSKLTSGLTYDQVIADLRYYMGTRWNQSTNEGSTTISDIRPGIENYARNHGYSLAKAVERTNPTWSTLKSDIEFGPNIITFTGQAYYNNGDSTRGHTVTGVGWEEYVYSGSSVGHQYMTIHDNWKETPSNVFVAYGRHYSNLWSVKFAPYLY